MTLNKNIDIVVEKRKKRTKNICWQEKNKYFFTIPLCLDGILGKYCIQKSKKSRIKKIKTCRNVRLVK